MGKTTEKDSKNIINGEANSKVDSKAKTIIKSVLFVAIFLLLLRTVSYVVRTNGSVKDRFSGFYAEPKNTIDAVIIGSSPVAPYYCTPKMFNDYGQAVYPLSSNAQRPCAAIGLTKEVYKRQSPQLMIYEVRMYLSDDHNLTNNMSYTRGVTDNLKYSPNRISIIDKMVKENTNKNDNEPLDSYYFDIMKYHSNWGMLFIPYEWRNWNYTAYDRYKGYEFKDTVGPCEYTDESEVNGIADIPPEQKENLDNLISYLQEQDQDALFIVSPYLEDEDAKKKYNYIEQTVTKAGYGFLDLNDHVPEMGLDYNNDIADYGTHVNSIGAEKCTDYLEKYLDENYSLPDHRNDQKYSRWETAYEDWMQKMNTEKQTIASKIDNKDYFVRNNE